MHSTCAGPKRSSLSCWRMLSRVATPPPSPLASAADIRTTLATYTAAYPHSEVIIGVVDGGEATVYTSNGTAAQPPDERTIFQVGSITKTFTATLLSQMVQAGQVSKRSDLEVSAAGRSCTEFSRRGDYTSHAGRANVRLTEIAAKLLPSTHVQSVRGVYARRPLRGNFRDAPHSRACGSNNTNILTTALHCSASSWRIGRTELRRSRGEPYVYGRSA